MKFINACSFVSIAALTHSNKDKADIALDDAENTAHFAKKTQYGIINKL